MKVKLITIIIVSASFFVACNNNPPKDINKVAASQKSVKTEKSCYLYSSNNDTVYLSLNTDSNRLSGELNFLPFEKDARIGTLSELKYQGDTLYAQYNSTQEGMTNICEIAFLKTKEGYIVTDDIWGGDNFQYNEAYTVGTFKDKHKIKFNGYLLKSVACIKGN